METLSGVAQTASKILFGEGATQQSVVPAESSTEPLSGETGTGTVDDPYDAGNNERKTEAANTNKFENKPDSPLDNTHDTKLDTKLDNLDGPPKDTESVHQPVQKSEEAERKEDAPINLDEPTAEDGERLIAMRSPDDHSGEPMKMHSDESVDQPKSTETSGEHSKEPADIADTPAEEAAIEAKEAGTGEKWVKSSGLAADGGDFDATQPGAGREADRLLEEKGIHKSDSGAHESGDGSGLETSTGGTEKVSKMQKLKEKLHIGSSKNA